MINKEHYEHAEKAHHIALKQKRIEHEKKIKANPAYKEIDEIPEYKPEPGESLEFAYVMVFNVYFRERWMRKPGNDIVSNAVTLERDLYNLEINYQSIQVKEDTNTV